MLVQIAKRIVESQGKLIAGCSVAKVEVLDNLGADEVVDYFAQKSLQKHLEKVYSERQFRRYH